MKENYKLQENNSSAIKDILEAAYSVIANFFFQNCQWNINFSFIFRCNTKSGIACDEFLLHDINMIHEHPYKLLFKIFYFAFRLYYWIYTDYIIT